MKHETMEHEYHEGEEATKRFEKLATAVFRAPKPAPKPKRTPKKTSKG